MTPPSQARPQIAPSVLQGPPLMWLVAVSSVAAMAINRILLILLDGRIASSSLLQLNQWGQWVTTLATLASLVAFFGALLDPASRSMPISLARRMIMGVLTGILSFVVARAAFMPRERAIAPLLWIAIGAADILVVYIALEGARWAKRPVSRVITLAAASMAILAVSALIVERFSQYQPGRWQLIMTVQLQRAGEAGYLVTLVGATALAIGRLSSRRDRVGLALSLLTFASTGLLGYWALLNWRGDLTLVLHYALRVSWLLDQVPELYLVIVCVSGAAALSAAFGGDASRKAVALGIILLICSGYAPRSHDRILIYLLAIFQLIRGVIIDASRVEKAK